MNKNSVETTNKTSRNNKTRRLITPTVVLNELTATEAIINQVQSSRQEISKIILGSSKKLLIIVGPCSIHDPKAAIDYAKKLKQLASQHEDTLKIIMRVYFEKPRTTTGWKGLINDPFLDNSQDINQGLLIARRLLLEINEIGMSTATEFVDTFTPQYLADLITWSAIGARTTESQMHRALASGLSMPVGFKNNTDGNIKVAINGIITAASSHCFLGINHEGAAAIVNTKGNQQGHVILRGGSNGPNYSQQNIRQTLMLLKENNLPQRLIIDCSHGNSNKDHQQQQIVLKNVYKQLKSPNHGIMGVMLESNLVAGKQNFTKASQLKYGQSITDSCIGWNETEKLINTIAQHDKKVTTCH